MSSENAKRRTLPSLRLKQYFSRGLWHPLTSVPIPIHGSHFDQHQIPPAYQETPWERGIAWLRYYTIQWRWDIERTVARILRKRWGT